MLVPKLRFKREDGTDYPEWKEKPFVSFCDVVTKQTGFDYSKTIKQALLTKQEDNTLPYLQTKNFSGKNFNYSTDYYIPIEVASQFEQIILDRKCLLFSIVGASVGNIALFPNTTKCFLSGAICVAKPIKEEQTAYLYYFMCSESGQSQIRNATKGSGQATVTIEDIRAFSIKTSCPEEQQKIAGFLSTVDEVITQSEAEVRNLEQQKKSAMQKIFSQELRFKREDGTEYPEWEQTSLEDVCNIVGGGTPSTKNIDYWNGNIQWFTPSEIGKTKYVSKSVRTISQVGFEKSSARKLPVGTILLTSRATLGEMAIATIECTTNQGFQSLIPRRINGEYLYYLQPTIKNYCNKKACGSTFNEISKGELGKCKIPMPHFEEQQKIADFLSAFDEAISYAKQELDKWKELKKGLLQQMFV
jgi:type I restriction enzyme S subunit